METQTTNPKTTQESEPDLPHDALYLVLSYLPVLDLLSISQVCKSFNESIQNDVLIWLDIYINKPLSAKISDDILLKITSRAQGRIRSLALINCSGVTDNALLQIIQTNPLIEKLYIPGCFRLSAEGVLRAVETLTTPTHKLKAIKISNIHRITTDHLQTLRAYFPTRDNQIHHPRYFHNRNVFSLREDYTHIPSIDVDVCPKCRYVTLVYDCTRVSCNQNQDQVKCIGCRYCIVRCEECGGCVQDVYYGDDDEVESACGDSMCGKCWLMLPKCDFCNKAYCKEHADAQGCISAGSSGFVCSVCLSDESHLDFV